MKFKFLSHTADLKFKAYGKTLEEVFSNSLLALASSVSEERISPEKKIEVSSSGKDYESLLYNFLEEILFFIDSKNFFPSKILNLKIDRKKLKLTGELYGDSGEKYKIYSHIKSVTYSDMIIRREKGRWVAQVVLDV